MCDEAQPSSARIEDALLFWSFSNEGVFKVPNSSDDLSDAAASAFKQLLSEGLRVLLHKRLESAGGRITRVRRVMVLSDDVLRFCTTEGDTLVDEGEGIPLSAIDYVCVGPCTSSARRSLHTTLMFNSWRTLLCTRREALCYACTALAVAAIAFARYAPVAQVYPPPLFKITAATHYDAGLQHGVIAADRIFGWLASLEMQTLLDFASHGAGAAALKQMMADNTAAYPHLADEVRGISDGAKIPLHDAWVATLINELEALMPDRPLQRDRSPGHCSDVYAVDGAGNFSEGHNEDWPGPVHDFYYYLAITGTGEPNSPGSCAGLIYPGALAGWAPSWNAHGVYLTQNSLFPNVSVPRGLGSAFVQRDALCGASGARGLDGVVKALSRGGWSSGASVNLVDLKARRMASFEAHVDEHAVREVPTTAGPANQTHVNRYKWMDVAQDGSHAASSLHRQARFDALPAPRGREDVARLLSDEGDDAYPVFREMTLASLVLDSTGHLDAWCCGHAPASGHAPAYSWDILHFF